MKKIAFIASRTKKAQDIRKSLEKSYGLTPLEKADAVVVLGGDGTMLRALHEIYEMEKPVYGMNLGSTGFLMNDYNPEKILPRLKAAEKIIIHPLRMTATDDKGKKHKALAFNEISLLRQSPQAAKIKVSIDGKTRLSELAGDGVLLATPAGSTAYNLSAHGPILPLSANLLALTPISPFRPRRWQGALLPQTARVKFEILEPGKRSVSATADTTEISNVTCVEIEQSKTVGCTLLFDPGHNLEERILKEQFLI